MFLITEFKRCRCCQETLPASAFSFIVKKLQLCQSCKTCCNKNQVSLRLERKKKRLAGITKAAFLVSLLQHAEATAQARQKSCKKYHDSTKEIRYIKRKKKIEAKYLAGESVNHYPNSREYSREYMRVRRAKNPALRILNCLQTRITTALKGTRKSARTAELLGCSVEELRQHLEKQFQPGMTWKNRGKKGWHIDHKRPCASFDLTDPAQQRECFHFSNLQPLWAKDNLTKSDSYVPVL